MSEEYTAALFDGEGGVSISYNESGYPQPRVYVTNTDKELLDSVRAELGFGVVRSGGEPRKKNHAQGWKLEFNSRDDKLRFLKLIQPFIRRRHTQVAAAIIILERMAGQGKEKNLPDREKLLRIRLAELIGKGK